MWKRCILSQRSFHVTTFIIAVVLLMSCWHGCHAKPKGDLCELNGEFYNVGEIWHPAIMPVTEKNCVNCTCEPGGKVSCNSQDCDKPECEDPKYVPGQCCPVCDVEVEEDDPALSPLPGCDYDGDHYENGQQFPSNRTAVKPLYDNQCVLCNCHRGAVICFLQTCLVQPGCLRIVRVSDDCCPQCEEYEEFPEEVAPSLQPWQRLEPGDCASSRGPQKNGTAWNPVIGQYGEMDCVVCHCHNGRVDCSRLKCPAESLLDCKRPHLRKGNCCRECPNGRFKGGRRDIRGKDKKGRKKKKNGKGCRKGKDGGKKRKRGKKRKKSCRKNKNRKSKSKQQGDKNGDVLISSPMTMDVVKPKLCVNKRADYLVYLTKDDRSYVLVLDSVTDDSMEKMEWPLRKGRISSSLKSAVTQTNVLRQKTDIKYLIGFTTKRNVKKFSRRLERKLQKCKKKCRRKLLDRGMKKLKVKSINLQKSCEKE